MQITKKILSRLNGLHYPQEYLCLAKESFQNPLHLYLVVNGQVIKDITNRHLFTGYCPLIFTLPSSTEINLSQFPRIRIIFSQDILQPNEIFLEKDAVAVLDLQQIHKQTVNNDTIYYYEGTRGKHHFVSSFHQVILNFNNNLYNKKPGNVFLPGNLYKQVQIAYALPRIISLVTIKQNDLFNLFPTDLHGQINEQNYVISLRHGGKAAQQVELTKKILITEIHAGFYKTVYSLGKNHMQGPKEKDKLPFSDNISPGLQLPLPQQVLHYRELELQDSFLYGIHKLFLFKIIYQQAVNDEPATLAHVHNCYATWRYKHRISSNFLLR